ncbi:MAG TPA: CarD family transcriptional regulator, partial [Rubrivivax sp.]|nr:CarD family transcriptional regulator [Rubrivivax sp.]
MQLPSIQPGKRFTLPRPTGSADALLLARVARSHADAKRLLAVFTAEASDAPRLADELLFFDPALRVSIFPDWETLPYDNFSPHQDLISERLATLWAVRNGEVDVVLLPAATALTRLAPPSFLAGTTFNFKQKSRLDEAKLKAQLTLAGYQHVTQVVSPGEYAVRGGLIDLFPMGSLVPYRVDLFGDEVDSIRTFDPDSQRSLYPVPEVRLLPGREFPMDEASRKAFRARWRERIEGDPTRSRIYKDIDQGITSGGIEYYLPLFFDEPGTIFDYLGAGSDAPASLVLHGKVDEALEHFWTDTRERHRFLQHDPERPLLPMVANFMPAEEFFARTQGHSTLALRGTDVTEWAKPLPDLSIDRGATEPLGRLERHLRETPARVLLVAESDGRRESLLDLLRDHGIGVPSADSLQDFLGGEEKVAIATTPLAAGFHWFEPDQKLSVQFVTETELFATTPQARRRRKQEQVTEVDALIKDLSELKVGDPVVHLNHGIGRYVGLKNIDLGEGNSEFLHLEYADKATLYVPVAQLHLISRYTGVSAEEAPLHKLGSAQWDKARRKAAEQVRDTAAELLNLYARRAAREGFAHRFSPHDYEAFATSFGFEETADQRAAIHAVIQDMISPKPMDRLVCGDVGFGKTEVALRAAFVAVHGGKQVAILAPTTLLAEQHYQTLVDRFGKWPVKIAELSRFRSPKEVKSALEGIAAGTVDIVVGTHKLLSSDVKFSRLGLL